MTPRQRDALEFISSYWAKHNCSPSYREIGDAIKGCLSHAHHTVNTLKTRGFLYVDRGRARAIYPMDVWRKLRGGDNHERNEKKK